MKKIVLVLFALFFVVSLSSCSAKKDSSLSNEYKEIAEIISENSSVKNVEFKEAVLNKTEDYYCFYLSVTYETSFSEGFIEKTEDVYYEYKSSADSTNKQLSVIDKVAFDTLKADSNNDSFTTVSNYLIDPYGIKPADSLLIALVCIVIVFGMLALLWGIVSLFKFLPKEKEVVEEAKPAAIQPVARPALKMSDIKDEDMMVAALVASIDYRNEVKEDVRVVSIREI